jgi:hypothetical protein
MTGKAANRSTGPWLRRVLALAALAVAAACSSIKVGYNNADTLLIYALDSYFDLDGRQEQRRRELLAWHRETQLRGYAEFVESAGRRLDSPVAADDVLGFNLEMNRRLVAIGVQAAPDLARLALTLQPDQLEHFAAKMAEDNVKARRESGLTDGGDKLEARVKRSAERVESWFGSVSPQQALILRTALAERPQNQAWWMQERERRQRDLLALLERIRAEQPAVEVAAGWLREYFVHLSEPRDPERREKMGEFRRANADLIAALVNAATPAQKSTLVEKLRGYAEDFTTLASSGARS